MNLTDIENNIHDIQLIWNELAQSDELPAKADAVVVGGSTDLGMAEKASELYKSGLSEKIVLSGYAQPHMGFTEAEMLARRCVELGVLPKHLILEKNASNTGENIRFAASLLGNTNSIILIHKPYMSRRFLATAKAQWPAPQPKLYVTHEDILLGDYLNRMDAIRTVRNMLGDFKRMELYPGQGFQAPQNMSPESKKAYQRLVALGLDVR